MKFEIGEYVRRKMDNAVGIVRRVDVHEERPMYLVELQEGPAFPADRTFWGNEGAWTPGYLLHAHLSRVSRDCDGEYTYEAVARMEKSERCSEFGDLEFKGRVTGEVISFHEYGDLSVTPEGVAWSMRTEEGYVHTEMTWCEEPDCEDMSTARDLSAERAGY